MPQTETKRKVRPEKRKKNESLQLLKNVAKSMAGAVPLVNDETRDTIEDSLARPLSGLASQFMGYNEDTGEVENAAISNLRRIWNADDRKKRGLPPKKRVLPGIVTDTGSLLNLLGNGPEWSQRMQELADATHEGVDASMDLAPPQGFRQNALNSLGVMAGQIPIPSKAKAEAAIEGGKGALQLMKRYGKQALTAPVEFFSPTIDPRMSNYLFGAGAGGALGALGDEVPLEEDQKPPSVLTRGKGGKVHRISSIVRQLGELRDKAYRKTGNVDEDGDSLDLPDRDWVEERVSKNRPEYLALLEDQGWSDWLDVDDFIDLYHQEQRSNPKFHLSPIGFRLPEDVPSWRRVFLKPEEEFREVSDYPQSTSMGDDAPEFFGDTRIEIEKGSDNFVVPNPLSGVSELIIPPNSPLTVVERKPRYLRVRRKPEEYSEGGKVGALQAFLKSISLNPDARVKQTAHQIGDPVEEVLYATNEGQRRGVLTSDEARQIKSWLESGEEEKLSEALMELHARLNPIPVGQPMMQNSPAPHRPLPSKDYSAPVNAHGTMPDDEFERILNSRKARGGRVYRRQ